MKLFFLIGSLQNGGSERQLLNLCKSIKKIDKAKVLIINWSGDDRDFFASDFEKNNIQVHFFAKKSCLIKKILTIIFLLRTQKPDVFHSFSYYLNFIPQLACIGTKVVPIGSLRSSFLYSQASCPLLVRLFNLNSRGKIISNSISGHQEFLEYNPNFKKENITIVNNHVNIHNVNLEKLFRYRREKDHLTSVSIGRCDANKRIDLIMELFVYIKSLNFNVKHFHLGDGLLLPTLKARCVTLGISDFFIFEGRVENIYERLQDADIFIHSAETEGSPNVVLEAMANALPVIATKCGDIPYIVDDGIDGILIDVNDKKQLIHSFILLSKDGLLREAIGENAFRKISNEYSVKKYGEKMLEAYKMFGCQN
jgi:GalNAc-alpha-(1->4)-GalNAc-alpha-(1->3)-diNAcBac-PP-undecaprenol alpha-1,4-N-acetyl-D-galactosaminyltransferase